ncbi:MAG: ABC transporter permease [Flavobacteriales bacterium]|nr:MAG: ABC transporter permease [Flavobacteriales bacterium]
MQLVKMAWRNIWRNKVRSLAVMTAVFLGLVAGMYSASLVEGIMQSRFENFIENQISHIQLHHPDFIRDQEVFLTVGGNLDNLQKVREIPGVNKATIRTRVQCMIASASHTGGVELYGIRPNSENETTKFARHLIDGDYLEGESSNGILIGESLAEKLKVGVGSRIVLSYQDKNNDLVSGAFIVRGIFNSGYTRYDEMTAFVFQEYLNDYLGIGEDFHELAILANDINDLENIRAELHQQFPNSVVRTWNEIEPALEVMVTSSGLFSYIFIILIMIGLAFGLLNTMLMAVFERTREIGMLMAVGMSRTKVFILIVLETIFLSLSGAVIGLFSGYLLVAWFAKHGLDLSTFSDVMYELGVDSVIYPYLNTSFPFILAIIVVATALLSAIYPAIKALSLSPIEAIRK